MITFPFVSAAELAGAYRKRAEELSADMNNLLPPWARQDADQLFHKRKIIICGSTCIPEIRVLAKHANVIGIVDDFAVGNRIFGIPVIHSDTWIRWAKKDKDIASCILVLHGRSFQYFVRQCIQWEIPFLDPMQILYLIKLNKFDLEGEKGQLLWYGFPFFAYAVENHDRLLKLSEHFEDEFSRITWLSVLLFRLTCNPFFLETCSIGYNSERNSLNSYAMNAQFMKFSDEEVYVDAGAYTGDTIELFLRAVAGKFKHIYSFEPSTQANRELRVRVNSLQTQYLDSFAEKFSFIEKGLWNSEGTLRFNPHDTFSGLSAHLVDSELIDHMSSTSGGDTLVDVPVTTIDGATNQDATFIKFEIEGSELQALQGAVKTLERNRPKMALSIYHKPDDYIKLVEFVMDTGLDYRMAVRQHNPLSPDATILYCHHDKKSK